MDYQNAVAIDNQNTASINKQNAESINKQHTVAIDKQISTIESKLVELDNIIRSTEQRYFHLQSEKNQKKIELEKIVYSKIGKLAKEGNDLIRILGKRNSNTGVINSFFANITQIVLEKYGHLDESSYCDKKISTIESELLEIENNEQLTEKRLAELHSKKESLKNEFGEIVKHKINELQNDALHTIKSYNKWYPNNKLEIENNKQLDELHSKKEYANIVKSYGGFISPQSLLGKLISAL